MTLVMRETGRGSAPILVCDHCGQRIERASDGNVEWRRGDDKVFHTHKRCSWAFEGAHGGRAKWSASEIDVNLLYLAHNLQVDWKKAEERAAWLESIEV